MGDDDLIVKMMTDAWLAGDEQRAFYLYDHWMLELTPKQEIALRLFLGDEYEGIAKEVSGLPQ